MGIDTVQLNNSDPMRESQNGMPEKRQIRLDKRKEQSRSSRANETEEQRQIRLEKQKKRDQSSLAIETDEERQIRLKKLKERSQSSRTNETEEQRQIRLKKLKERSGSRRTNETIEQRQIRLKELKERSQSSRTNETVEQRQIRLDKQRKRSQADRAKKKLEKRASNKSGVQQQDIEMQFAETDDHASLPLKLDDLCDTLKVIFVGARPPERIHLKKVLTVRKKKIIQALHWLKKYNVLYQNVTINLENIAELPEDDVPECIMSTLEQKLGDEEIQSERVGYVPDPLSNPIEHTTADTIPISNSNILKTMIVDGVLGPIKAYFGTVESQGRGSLHLHMLIWLDHDLKPADMKEKIQNADFREKLKAYLEDIIKEDLDDFKDKQVFENLNVPRSFDTPPRLSEDNIYAALRTIDLTAHGQSSSNEFIDHTGQQLVPFVFATPNLVHLNTKWQEQLKMEKERIRRNLITGNYDKTDGVLDLYAAKDAIITVVNPNNYNTNNFENYAPILPVASVITTSYPTQKSVADELTLNREQRAAFMIITSHLDGDKQCHTGDNNGQLIMCIPGCGGTGKSQLIRAVTKYFSITKRMQMIRKLAPTGIAAAEIDGMTIHSFLGEHRNSGKPRTIKPGDLKLEKEWRLIEYLLIDEMSMVGLTLLAKLNRIISAAKHVDPQIPFGGVNVIFFGDYLQYRPIYDAPLHTDFSSSSKKKSGKLPTEKEIQQRVARSLILQINCVVKLTQQMRTEDTRYLQLLERLRQGQCNYDDYELLLTRVVGQPSVNSLHESPWNKAPILVFRNEVRTQINHKAAIQNAAQLNCAPIVCVAQDTCKGKPIEDPILRKKLLELSDSKTEHLSGLLPLVPGMPVILTQNIAIELGLINGMKGIFRQLVYQADSVSTDALSNIFPNNTQYVYRPSYALIEIIRSKIECNLENLQPKLVPIPIMEQTFRIDISDILPKDKKPKPNRKAMLSIKRRALPLVPAYSITTHKSQGQTLMSLL
ncbi:unnamed protein product [Rotaria sordida]|uniref:ATP-dependent DNA helicase n=1 Tax=Rotaria sordida TaxID=392033 RepID=A0A815JR04_9BILA|nr:unnamed protein product [Rotaria sordida]